MAPRWCSGPQIVNNPLTRVGIEITKTGDMGWLQVDLELVFFAIHCALRYLMIRRILTVLHADIHFPTFKHSRYLQIPRR